MFSWRYRTRGLQAEIEDEPWDALCEATRDEMVLLQDGAVAEAHRWAHLLAHARPDAFRAILSESLPMDPTLKTILQMITSDDRLWSDHLCNEDTYLKSQLGPFLDTWALMICLMCVCVFFFFFSRPNCAFLTSTDHCLTGV